MSAVMDAVEPGLSKQQHSTYIAVIESLFKVATPAQFIQWVKGELQTLQTSTTANKNATATAI